MQNYICVTCGNQFAATEEPPPNCPICEDERQYVNPAGQSWTTHAALLREHHNILQSLEPGLTEIVTDPAFGIGQRALLVQTPKGNVLWDCLGVVDDGTIGAIGALGGISSLAMSHPHMFGCMVEWSHAFDDAPVHLHADLRRWVQRPDPVIDFWEGESRDLDGGLQLYRCGGHFQGSTVLLWPEGAQGRGALLSSDTIHVARDRRHVSFMYSYPNYIPLPAAAVDRIVNRVMPLKFDRIYSAFHHLEIEADAKGSLERSVARYKRAIGSGM
ncbi:MAG: hypothetical protein WD906_00010 [Anaerolineales bacterium]